MSREEVTPAVSRQDDLEEEHQAIVAGRQAEEVFLASQWQLMRWKFQEHKLAVASALILVMFYLVAIFAEVVAPYDPIKRDPGYVLGPPQRLHFFAEDGFHLRPFVYGVNTRVDMTSMQRIYTDLTDQRYSLRFLVRGHPYKFWGFIRADLHLFGVEEGGSLYLLGTDRIGRDMFSRIVYGARVTLSIGLVGVLFSLVIGLTLGGIAGYFGGTVDNVIQRLSEVVRSFPTIPLWLGLSAALPVEWPPLLVYFGITLILSLRGWTGLARQARGKILSLKNDDFVLAARLLGAPTHRIIRVHLIPSFLSHIIATLTLVVPGMILGETSLSFLGLGLRDPVVSWGVLLQKAQNVHTLAFNPWLLIPGGFVIVTVLCFNFVGDGLRDAADPYSVAK